MKYALKGMALVGMCAVLALLLGHSDRSAEAAEAAAVLDAPQAQPTQYLEDLPEEDKNLVKMTPEIREVVKKGLDWLVESQGEDGVWHQAGNYALPISCMAGLALCSWAGPGEGPKAYKEAVKKLAEFIIAHADRRNGYIYYNASTSAMHGDDRPAYGHSFGLLFLTQVYGSKLFTGEEQKEIREIIMYAITFIEKHQHPTGCWYQNYINGHNQIVTVSHLQALRAANQIGFKVNKKVINKALEFNEQYLRGGSTPSRMSSCTAVQLVAGDYTSGNLKKAVKIVLDNCKDPKNFELSSQQWANFFHLYTSQICYFLGGEAWKNYYTQVSKWYVSKQQQDGSWPALPNVHAVQPSTVYTSALACLILQMPNRNLPMFYAVESGSASEKLLDKKQE